MEESSCLSLYYEGEGCKEYRAVKSSESQDILVGMFQQVWLKMPNVYVGLHVMNSLNPIQYFRVDCFEVKEAQLTKT